MTTHPKSQASTLLRRAGFSMTEVIATIAIMGVLAGICIAGMTGVLKGSKSALAEAKLEMLNKGLDAFAYSNLELTFNVLAGSTGDEFAVLRFLQYRDANENRATVGSPYVRPDYNPASSSSPDDYRIIWKGSRYALLRPGTNGAGMKVVFDGSDYTVPFVFPPGFSRYSR